MSEQFEIRLIECLDAIEIGGPDGAEAILARYPDDAVELRQALGVASALASLDTSPDAAAQEKSRRAFLAQAAALAGGSSRQASGRRFLLRAAALLGVVVAAGAIPVAASANALPGDPLYGVKRQVEAVQLDFAPDEAARKALVEQNNERRFKEIDQLVSSGRAAEIDFEGRLSSVSDAGLVIDGRPVTVPAGMHLPALSVGGMVEVTVQIQGGALILVSIVPIGPVETHELTPTPAPSAAPTETAQPVETKAPEVHETPKPESTEDGGSSTEVSGGGEGGQQTEQPGATETETSGSGSDGASGDGSTSGGSSGGSDDSGGGSSGGGSGGGGGHGGGGDS